MTPASKKYVLTAVSTAIVIVFFSIPFYQNWYKNKVWIAVESIPEQLLYMEPEERLGARLTNSYRISAAVREDLKNKGLLDSAIVLLPPQGYIDAQKFDYPVPEPAVFYYYTGVRSKWTNSPGVENVTHALFVMKGVSKLIPVNDTILKEILKFYEPYPIK